MKRITIAVLLLAAVAFSQTAAKPGKASVPSVREAWITAYNAKQADKVAALYAADAVMVSSAGTLTGRDAIKAQIQKDLDNGGSGIQVVPTKSGGDADFQWETGDFSQKMGGKEVRGRYLVDLKMVGGKWEIVAHASMPSTK